MYDPVHGVPEVHTTEACWPGAAGFRSRMSIEVVAVKSVGAIRPPNAMLPVSGTALACVAMPTTAAKTIVPTRINLFLRTIPSLPFTTPRTLDFVSRDGG